MTTEERPDLTKLCGLKEQPTNGTQWHEAVTAGLPMRAVRVTAKAIGVRDIELAELLQIDPETVGSKDAVLSRDASNFLHRIALTYTRAYIKMADAEQVATWMRTAQATLKNYIPILLLQSHIGAEYVFTAIERMEAPKSKLIHQEEAPDAGTAEFEHNVVDENEPNPFDDLGRDD
jgi:putative toxin-antitoxin system antitoxin component (TIGR02293 family)